MEKKPRLVAELAGHTDRVWCVAWHPHGSRLASCSGDGSIRIWRLQLPTDGRAAAWTCAATLDRAHRRTVRCVAWSPCGRYLASASFDGTTAVWERMASPRELSSGDSSVDRDGGASEEDDEEEWECIATLEGHENEVKSVCWFADSALLATCSRDKSVWIWEMTPGADFECLAVLTEHTQDVKCVRFHPQRPLLASASYDDTVRLWQEDPSMPDEFACAQVLQGHSGTVWAVDWAPDGSALASCSADGSLRVYQPSGAGWKLAAVRDSAHSQPVYSVSWAPSGNLVASAGADNALRVWRVVNPAEGQDAEGSCELYTEICEAHGKVDVNCVAWNQRHGALLATASDGPTVRVWELSTLNPESGA